MIPRSETVFGIPDQLAIIDRRLVSQQEMIQVPGQLRTISQELIQQRTERRTETTMWEEHRTTLGQVSHGVSHLRQGMDSATQEMLTAQAAQGTETNQKLDKILEQMLKLTLERQQPNMVIEVSHHGPPTPEPTNLGPCSNLLDSIARLCRLVDTQQGSMRHHNSPDVVNALLAMLSCMMSGEFLQGAVAAHLVKVGLCERCHGRHLETLKTCVSSVYGVLLSSRRTTLNHHGIGNLQ